MIKYCNKTRFILKNCLPFMDKSLKITSYFEEILLIYRLHLKKLQRKKNLIEKTSLMQQ